MACEQCGYYEPPHEQDTTGGDLEAVFRRVLLRAYTSLTEREMEEVLEAKIADELSFFHFAGYTLESAKVHWKWYLYCLTFHSSEFSTDGKSWDKLPRSNKVVARLPLDSVDLCLLARWLKAQITVSRLDHAAMRFLPDQSDDLQEIICLHLLVHKGLWAPVLSTVDWESCRIDYAARVGSIVEIHEGLPSSLEGFAGLVACVTDFDAGEGCYTACCGVHQIPLHSTQIRRVLSRSCDLLQRESDVTHDIWPPGVLQNSRSGYMPGEAPTLDGIPDASLEFQFLLQMIMHDLGRRLRTMREQLAGRPLRDEAKKRNKDQGPQVEKDELLLLQQQPPKLGDHCPSCLSLPAVVQLLNNSTLIWTRCPSTVQKGQTQLKRQEFVCLVAADVREDGSLFFRARTASKPHAFGIESDDLSLWIAAQDFQADSNWSNLRLFLQVWQGESLAMVERQRHKWDGWGKMRRLDEDLDSVGLVPLRYLVPHIWVAKLDPA